MTEASPPLLLEREPPQQEANELLLAVPLPEFRVGRACARAFEILRRKPLVFLLPIAAIHLAEFLLEKLWQDWVVARISDASTLHTILTLLLASVGRAAGQAVIAHAVLQALRGQPVRPGMSSRLGLAQSVAVVGTALCSSFLVSIGSFLLLAPGVWAVAAFLVAVPACVIEGKGPLASLRRSAELTRGYRWRVLGLWLVLFIAGGIYGFVSLRLAIASSGTVGMAIWIARSCGSVVIGTYAAMVYVATYHGLRAAKEGDDLARIAEVFD